MDINLTGDKAIQHVLSSIQNKSLISVFSENIFARDGKINICLAGSNNQACGSGIAVISGFFNEF